MVTMGTAPIKVLHYYYYYVLCVQNVDDVMCVLCTECGWLRMMCAYVMRNMGMAMSDGWCMCIHMVGSRFYVTKLWIMDGALGVHKYG